MKDYETMMSTMERMLKEGKSDEDVMLAFENFYDESSRNRVAGILSSEVAEFKKKVDNLTEIVETKMMKNNLGDINIKTLGSGYFKKSNKHLLDDFTTGMKAIEDLETLRAELGDDIELKQKLRNILLGKVSKQPMKEVVVVSPESKPTQESNSIEEPPKKKRLISVLSDFFF